jgi:hypothetical protein
MGARPGFVVRVFLQRKTWPRARRARAKRIRDIMASFFAAVDALMVWCCKGVGDREK